jgi:hypothetical protein
MEIKASLFYLEIDKELSQLGFGQMATSSNLFPIWHHVASDLYVQAISISHFSNYKNQISATFWQEMILNARQLYTNYLCIWEDKWIKNSRFIQDYFKFCIQGNFSVFARDLKTTIIPENLAAEFLGGTHILGFSKGKTYLGLYVPPHRQFRGIQSPYHWEGNPLIGVAVFGKILHMKDEAYHGQVSAELVRFASLPGTRIVGGITKALAFYQKAFHIDNVMTYVDMEWNSGQGFLGIGFKLESLTNPLLFKIDSSLNRNLVQNWEDANVCNEGNWKLRYELK